MQAMNRLFSVCNKRRSCRKYYPQVEQHFFLALEELKRQPVALDIKSKWKIRNRSRSKDTSRVYVDEVLFLELVNASLRSREGITGLPRLIRTTTARLDRYLREAIENEDLSNILINPLATNTIRCNDGVWFSREERPASWSLPSALRRWDGILEKSENCQPWMGKLSAAPESNAIQSNVPTLLLSGAFDPVTPPRLATEVHKSLPNSFQYIFPRNGHDAESNPCAKVIIWEFLKKPNEKPKLRCQDDVWRWKVQ